MAFMGVGALSEGWVNRAQVYTVMLIEMVRRADNFQNLLGEAKSHRMSSIISRHPDAGGVSADFAILRLCYRYQPDAKPIRSRAP
jgi:hypothetical protein